MVYFLAYICGLWDIVCGYLSRVLLTIGVGNGDSGISWLLSFENETKILQNIQPLHYIDNKLPKGLVTCTVRCSTLLSAHTGMFYLLKFWLPDAVSTTINLTCSIPMRTKAKYVYFFKGFLLASSQLLTNKMRHSSKEFASSSCFFPTFKPVFIGSCAYGADRDGNS